MLERKRKIVREKEKYIAKEKKVAPPPLLSRFEGIASGGIGKGGEKRAPPPWGACMSVYTVSVCVRGGGEVGESHLKRKTIFL